MMLSSLVMILEARSTTLSEMVSSLAWTFAYEFEAKTIITINRAIPATRYAHPFFGSILTQMLPSMTQVIIMDITIAYTKGSKNSPASGSQGMSFRTNIKI